jgi:hypothetical protein
MKASCFRLVLLSLIAAGCLIVTPRTFAQRHLDLNVSIITGEHSRDSSSIARSFTVSANTLVYEETHYGARANRYPPLKKEYQLRDDDRARLIGLLKAKRLLRTRSISKSPALNARTFEIGIAAKLSGHEGLISIKAPRSATELKTVPLYQDSVLLIAELYRIINRTEPDISLGELIP